MRKRYGLNPSIFAAALVTVMCLAAVVRVGASEKSGKIIEFKGTCDGSAAVRIRGDTLLVAYDEKNLLYTYSVSGGKWKRDEEIGDKLALLRNKKDSEMEEMDLEGAAQDGNRIWWVGSHSLNKSGKEQPNRRALFATNVPKQKLDNIKIVEPRVDLTEALLANKEVAERLTDAAWARAPLNGGVSIEGLAVDKKGRLFLGFRSPLSMNMGRSGDAMIVLLDTKKKPFKVKRVHRLDLGDRGVRDIVRHGSSYVILAGRVSRKKDFALFRWDGQSAPERIRTKALDGLNPEALVPLKDDWLVLSDDGKEARKGEEICDKLRETAEEDNKEDPRVYFRARRFSIER